MPSCYPDRRAAGQALAAELLRRQIHDASIVLALPRGGVPVGAEVARALSLPLDVFIVRKLGVPDHEELAFGAIASGGARILNREIIEHLKISDAVIVEVTRHEAEELHRREHLYRDQRPPLELGGGTVILVDDGLATGASMRAAVASVRALGAARVVVAVPVASPATCAQLEREVDELICPMCPAYFEAVGQWYLDFTQTTDEEVRAVLESLA